MAESSSEAETSPVARAVALVASFGPPIAVVTALLIYFGWSRSDAQSRAMGVDVSLFGYTPQDYVLRSIRSLFLPLVLIAILAIGWLAADRWLTRHALTGPHRERVRRVALGAVYAGVVAAGVCLAAAILRPGSGALFLPYLMAAAVELAVWGVHIRRQGQPGDGGAERPVAAAGGPGRYRALESALVFTLVTLLLFWGTADFAQAVGRGLAVQVEQGVGSMPRATLFSKTRLAIGAANVTEKSLGTGTAPLYTYRGLRLLVVSGGKFFFLHNGWTLRSGTVVVLPDDDSIRVELGN
ncbi:hypothetical protein [Specibacter sp. RAF43]|uniref:hypothetical protein n=1 Tax=Specibacter sp. RAF43 TaxID=3233057 RepID=UPI003F969A31